MSNNNNNNVDWFENNEDGGGGGNGLQNSQRNNFIDNSPRGRKSDEKKKAKNEDLERNESSVNSASKPNFPRFQEYVMNTFPYFFAQNKVTNKLCQILFISTSKKEYKQISVQKFHKYLTKNFVDLEGINRFQRFIPTNQSVPWVDIYMPGKELGTLQYDLENFFGVHKLTIEQILSPAEKLSEKLEQILPYYYHVVLKEKQQGSGEWKDSTVHLLLFHDIIISLHHKPLQNLSNVLYQIIFPTKGVISSSDWILYQFLESIVNEFVAVVDAIYQEVNNLPTLVHQLTGGNSDEELITRFGRTNRAIALLRAQLMNKKDTLKTLTGEKSDNYILHPTLFYLHDVLDKISSMIQRLQLTAELLNNISSSYLDSVALRISNESHRTNYEVKKMTIIAAVTAPMAVVAGLWGMNVPVPGRAEDVPGGDAWFWLIVVCLILYFLIVLCYFYRSGVMTSHRNATLQLNQVQSR